MKVYTPENARVNRGNNPENPPRTKYRKTDFGNKPRSTDKEEEKSVYSPFPVR